MPLPGAAAGLRKKGIGGKLEFRCDVPAIAVFNGAGRRRPGFATCPKPDRSVPRKVRRKAMIVCSYGEDP